MNISFECPDKLHGLLTLTMTKADYEPAVEKTLKKYRAQVNVPGFRPGKAPLAMVKRQYGERAKIEEIDNLLSTSVSQYVLDNKIAMLGAPLPSSQTDSMSMDDDPLVFKFDVAVAPEFDIELSEADKLDYYKVDITPELIDNHIDTERKSHGKFAEVGDYDPEGRCLVEGDVRELNAEGAPKEGGVDKKLSRFMPQYIKDDEQRKLFDGSKVGDTITFSPAKAYSDNPSEIASLLGIDKDAAKDFASDVAITITKITRYEKSPIDQALFDSVLGKGVASTEEQFRQEMGKRLKDTYAMQSNYVFSGHLKDYIMKKVGHLPLPDDLLKRVLVEQQKVDAGKLDEMYESSANATRWGLVKEKLISKHPIKVTDDDMQIGAETVVKDNLAQYGIYNIPKEALAPQAKKQLEDPKAREYVYEMMRDIKLFDELKAVVKPNVKKVSAEELAKLQPHE